MQGIKYWELLGIHCKLHTSSGTAEHLMDVQPQMELPLLMSAGLLRACPRRVSRRNERYCQAVNLCSSTMRCMLCPIVEHLLMQPMSILAISRCHGE